MTPLRSRRDAEPGARCGLAMDNATHVAISTKIDDTLQERVQHVANLRQRSAHWIMRAAIAQYVEREEARESFRQEATAS